MKPLEASGCVVEHLSCVACFISPSPLSLSQVTTYSSYLSILYLPFCRGKLLPNPVFLSRNVAQPCNFLRTAVQDVFFRASFFFSWMRALWALLFGILYADACLACKYIYCECLTSIYFGSLVCKYLQHALDI